MSLSTPVAGIALVLSFAVGVAGLVRRRRVDAVDWPTVRRSLALSWLAWAVAVGLVLAAGRPADLGLGPDAASVGTLVDGFLFGFIAFAGPMILSGLAADRLGETTGGPAVVAVLEQPARRRLAVAVTGAVVETTLAYGVALGAAQALGGGPWLAGAVAAGSQLLSRASAGPVTVLAWVPGAVALAWVALTWPSLVVLVGIRLLYDALTLLSGEPEEYGAPANPERSGGLGTDR